MALQSYRDLLVWQKSMDLADICYDLTASFPKDERFGLTAQIRDASTSITSNIAEGYGRRHRGDYLHHLSIASGSLAEVQTRLLLSVRRKFLTAQQLEAGWDLAQEVGRMLHRQVEMLEAEMPRDPITGRLSRRLPRKIDPNP